MRFLLDTNVCVDYLTGRYPGVRERIQGCDPGEVCLSSIVAAEVRFGADKSVRRLENHRRLDVLLGEIRCMSFDEEAARSYGKVRRSLQERGTPIGPHDMLIAAHALSCRLILVTDNVRELERVQGLRIENWRRAPA